MHEGIIEELQRQLAESNEVVFNQWQENQSLQETMWSYEYEAANLSEMREALGTLTSQLTGQEMTLREKENSIENQAEEIAELQSQLARQATSVQSSEQRLLKEEESHQQYRHTICGQLAVLEGKLADAEKLAAEKDLVCKRKDESLDTLNSELATEKGRSRAMEEQLEKAHRKFEQHNRALHEQQAQRLLEAVNNSTEKAEAERTELLKKLKAANLANEKLQQELSGRSRELQQLEDQKRTEDLEREEADQRARAREEERQKALDDATTKLGIVEVERADLKEQLRTADQNNKKLGEELSGAQSASEVSGVRVRQLEISLQELSSEKEQLQELHEVAVANAAMLQQALIEAERAAEADESARDKTASAELSAALKVANDSLMAFRTSQDSREKLQTSLEEFSGGRLASAKWLQSLSRLQNDKSSTIELGEQLEKVLRVHEVLLQFWERHDKTVFEVSQNVESSLAPAPGFIPIAPVSNAATSNNVDHERRVSIKSPAVLEGVDMPISVEQERLTRRGLVVPRSIMKLQSQISENPIADSQADDSMQAHELEIPDSQVVVQPVAPRANLRRPVVHTMYNRRVSSSSTGTEIQPLEAQNTGSSAAREGQSHTTLHDLAPRQGSLSTGRMHARNTRKAGPGSDDPQRKRLKLSRSMSQYFSQPSEAESQSSTISALSSQERRGGPIERKSSRVITYSQQTALRA
ncbi:uncharacterized protein B0I36DRAFT_15747 [Microdochium trichocladiopsis]|uniref:Uncharacterized protein n=1 Tax=Microdochium trichocladiopsis TaxID=1682393 RepID=A0A9P9BVY7_9PEZI|nr:uncharacterized protein B0I36DRAFT_15747 [Microdochium trichocladiopsis]KAH7040813.1 hypothetical protein B0I36DRAFT_15747 [Microdochium trichocladiopsis]